jgi:hypothetical protein
VCGQTERSGAPGKDDSGKSEQAKQVAINDELSHGFRGIQLAPDDRFHIYYLHQSAMPREVYNPGQLQKWPKGFTGQSAAFGALIFPNPFFALSSDSRVR